MFPSEVIMKDYKADHSGETIDLPVEQLKDKFAKRVERNSKLSEAKSEGSFSRSGSCSKNEQNDAQVVKEVERPQTPNFDELSLRFENLLSVLNSRNNSVEADINDDICDNNDDEDDNDNVFLERADHHGPVYLNLSQPPDILDFSRRSHSDLELEDVNITVDGIEVVSDNDEDLPQHIQEMVNKAMKEMK